MPLMPENYMESEDAPESEDISMTGLNARQVALYHAIDSVENLLGEFDQDMTADGAHYGPVSPWADQGLKCANCVSYMGVVRACHWVEGDIDPNGICKLWIIPDSKITETDD